MAWHVKDTPSFSFLGYTFCYPNWQGSVYSGPKLRWVSRDLAKILHNLLSADKPELANCFNLEHVTKGNPNVCREIHFLSLERTAQHQPGLSPVPHRCSAQDRVKSHKSILRGPISWHFVVPPSDHSTLTKGFSKFTVLTLPLWIMPMYEKVRSYPS